MQEMMARIARSRADLYRAIDLIGRHEFTAADEVMDRVLLEIPAILEMPDAVLLTADARAAVGSLARSAVALGAGRAN